MDPAPTQAACWGHRGPGSTPCVDRGSVGNAASRPDAPPGDSDALPAAADGGGAQRPPPPAETPALRRACAPEFFALSDREGQGRHSAPETEREPKKLHRRQADWFAESSSSCPSSDSEAASLCGGHASLRCGYGAAAAAKRLSTRKPVFVPGTPPSGLKALLDVIVGFALWFGDLERNYGSNLMWLLFASQHLLKGVVQQLQDSSIMWVFMEYRISGPQMQIFISVAGSAWALKPLIGALSDIFPIGGLRRGPYCVMASLLGVACTTLIGVSTTTTASAEFIVLCLWGLTLQVATCDLLTEAKYSEHLSERPEHGPDLMAYVWGGISVGNLFAIGAVGYIVSQLGPRFVYMACIVPCAAMLIPAMSNYFEEQELTRSEVATLRQTFLEQGEIVFLCGLVTLASLFLSLQGLLFESKSVLFAASLLVMAVLLPAFHILLRPEIAKVNMFFVLQSALSLGIGGATFYFYTDQEEQFPEGPHFSAAFFTTGLGLVACVMSLLGLVVYTRYMKHWSYRGLLMMTNVAVTLLSLLDVVFFRRWNLVLGIADPVFVLGSSVCTVVIRQWQWMPAVVIMSQLCPSGMQATMYALLAGCSTVGGQVADYLGAYMLDAFGVHPNGASGEGHQFDNLWKASALSTLLPGITIALIPLLIPQARQTDRLLLDEPGSATSGSLYSRWRTALAGSRDSSGGQQIR